MAKIIKIGTFNKQGFPIEWDVDMEEAKEWKEVKEVRHVLGIIDDKVYVNGVEIVEWTEERKRCMKEG